MKYRAKSTCGFTYVELLIAVTMGALLVLGLSGVVGQALQTRDVAHARNDLSQQAHFALQRMALAVSQSRLLLLPLADKTTTLFAENIREQTNPASPPPAGSSLATAVLAVTLPAYVDLDGNGNPDADNAGDGRFDEDLPADANNDGKPGILMIDDDGNGVFDFFLSPIADDDEGGDLAQNEDSLNGVDDDGDGVTDEDPGADNNGDGCPGICAVDDDADGNLDEGAVADDDEDASSDEDWYDNLVFYLDNGVLKERMPVPWDTNSDSLVTGADYITSDIAEHVTRFRVERIPQSGQRWQLIDLTLELTSPTSGESVSLRTQIRVGGAL